MKTPLLNSWLSLMLENSGAAVILTEERVAAKESRPILESDKLVEYCHSRGIVAERLFGLKEIVL